MVCTAGVLAKNAFPSRRNATRCPTWRMLSTTSGICRSICISPPTREFGPNTRYVIAFQPTMLRSAGTDAHVQVVLGVPPRTLGRDAATKRVGVAEIDLRMVAEEKLSFDSRVPRVTLGLRNVNLRAFSWMRTDSTARARQLSSPIPSGVDASLLISSSTSHGNDRGCSVQV